MQNVQRIRQTEKPEKEKMTYRNSDVESVINEYIHNKRDRDLLKRRLIDGICFEPLAEEFNLSVRQTKRIIYKYDKLIIKMAQKRHG